MTGLGRFLSEDPLGLGGGDTDYYSYSGNSPLEFTDPEGLALPWCARRSSKNSLSSLWNGSTRNCKRRPGRVARLCMKAILRLSQHGRKSSSSATAQVEAAGEEPPEAEALGGAQALLQAEETQPVTRRPAAGIRTATVRGGAVMTLPHGDLRARARTRPRHPGRRPGRYACATLGP